MNYKKPPKTGKKTIKFGVPFTIRSENTTLSVKIMTSVPLNGGKKK